MGIIAVMEAAENEELGAENLEQAADQAAAVGENRVEVNDSAADIGADTEDVEKATDDIEELQEIGEVAEASVESGEGLSEQAAEVATIAIERIHQRLGFRGKQKIIPATESFGQAKTRLASTQLVLESIADTIKSVWEAIKNMAKRIWDKIVQFFKKIFGGAKALKDHLENLKKRAEAIDAGAKPKEAEISTTASSKITVDGKANLNGYKKIVGVSLDLASRSKNLASSAATISAVISNGVSDMLDADGPKNEKAFDNFAKELSEIAKKTGAVVGSLSPVQMGNIKTEGPVAGKVVSSVAYGPFTSSKVLVFQVVESEDGVRSGILFMDALDEAAAKKADALDKAGVLNVLAAAQEAADAALSLEETSKMLESVTKSVQTCSEKVIEAVKRAVSGGEDKEGKAARVKAMESAQVAIRSIFKNQNMLGVTIPKLILDAGYAGADYASACISNLRVEKAK